jgi:hypothetical protein
MTTYTYTKVINNLTNLNTYLNQNITGISSVSYDPISTITTVVFYNIISSSDIPLINNLMYFYKDSNLINYDMSLSPFSANNSTWTKVKGWNYPNNINDINLLVWKGITITSDVINSTKPTSGYNVRLMDLTNRNILLTTSFSNSSLMSNFLSISPIDTSSVLNIELQANVNNTTDSVNITTLSLNY